MSSSPVHGFEAIYIGPNSKMLYIKVPEVFPDHRKLKRSPFVWCLYHYKVKMLALKEVRLSLSSFWKVFIDLSSHISSAASQRRDLISLVLSTTKYNIINSWSYYTTLLNVICQMSRTNSQRNGSHLWDIFSSAAITVIRWVMVRHKG